MQTPAPTRHDDHLLTAARQPSGSLLFPTSSSMAGSPMLSAKSPMNIPFTLGSATPATHASAQQSAFTPAPLPGAAPLPAAARIGGGGSTIPPAAAASGFGFGAGAPPNEERPPLQSLLDADSSLPRRAVAQGGPTPARPRCAGAAGPTTALPSQSGAPRAGGAAELGAPATACAPAAGHWVTAFGYPSSNSLPAVLEELRPPGEEVVRHALGSGPWVHVQFREASQLRRALGCNGRVVQGFMMGVVEGICPTDDTLRLPTRPRAGTAVPLKLQPQPSSADATGIAARLGRVTIGEAGRAGIFTRACEYIFGW